MLASDLLLDLPYVATDRKKIETIIKFAQIKPGQTVIDLGSGDGRLLIANAKKGACAIGYEINPLLIVLTKMKFFFLSLRAKRSNLKNEIATLSKTRLAMTKLGKVIVKRKNLWQADLKVADVIFVYSLRRDIKKFEDFVYQNAKKGARVIVNTNPFPTKKPLKRQNNIFLYKV